MSLEELEGVSISAEEKKKVEDALAALAEDPHAPKELSVRVTLHVHHEYPKHVVAGIDKDKNPIIKVAHSAEEEKRLAEAKPLSA